MSKSDPDVPRMFFMQISAAITEKSVINNNLARNADSSTNNGQRL